MANVTYRDLLGLLSKFDDTVLNQNISVYIPGLDEYCPVAEIELTTESNDVLDPLSVVLKL